MRWKLWVTVTGPSGTREVPAAPHEFDAKSYGAALNVASAEAKRLALESMPSREASALRIIGIRLEEETVNPIPLRWRDHEGFRFSRRLEDAVSDFFNGGYLLVVPGGFLVVDGDDLVVQAGLRTKEQMAELNGDNGWSEVSTCLAPKCDEFCVGDYCKYHGR